MTEYTRRYPSGDITQYGQDDQDDQDDLANGDPVAISLIDDNRLVETMALGTGFESYGEVIDHVILADETGDRTLGIVQEKATVIHDTEWDAVEMFSLAAHYKCEPEWKVSVTERSR